MTSLFPFIKRQTHRRRDLRETRSGGALGVGSRRETLRRRGLSHRNCQGGGAKPRNGAPFTANANSSLEISRELFIASSCKLPRIGLKIEDVCDQ